MGGRLRRGLGEVQGEVLVLILLLLVFVGGYWAGKLRAGGEARVRVRETIVRQAFDRYLDVNGALHPQDPRRVELRVVR